MGWRATRLSATLGPVRRSLGVLAAAWLVVNVAAGWVSVTHRLPADLSIAGLRIGPLPPDTVLRDWILGAGAGLAVPGLLLAIALLASAFGGRFGTVVLALVGVTSLVDLLGQVSTSARLQPSGASAEVTGLLVANLVLSVILTLASGIALASGTQR